jgi:hypothetical protein
MRYEGTRYANEISSFDITVEKGRAGERCRGQKGSLTDQVNVRTAPAAGRQGVVRS